MAVRAYSETYLLPYRIETSICSLRWALLSRWLSIDFRIGHWLLGCFRDWMWFFFAMYGERPTMPCSLSRRDYYSPWTSSWAVRMLDAGTSHVIAWLLSHENLGHACFSLFDPCTLSLSGTRQPTRWTQNGNQLLEWWRPCRCHVLIYEPLEGWDLRCMSMWITPRSKKVGSWHKPALWAYLLSLLFFYHLQVALEGIL